MRDAVDALDVDMAIARRAREHDAEELRALSRQGNGEGGLDVVFATLIQLLRNLNG